MALTNFFLDDPRTPLLWKPWSQFENISAPYNGLRRTADGQASVLFFTDKAGTNALLLERWKK